MSLEKTILLVDDSENDLLLMRTAFRKAPFDARLLEVRDGEQAIAYLKGDGLYGDRTQFPLPAVMLMDLNMPKKSGFEVLTWVRAQRGLKRLSIFVLSASMRTEDVAQAFDLGAHAFLVKPGTIDQLTAMIRSLRDWMHIIHFPPLDSR